MDHGGSVTSNALKRVITKVWSVHKSSSCTLRRFLSENFWSCKASQIIQKMERRAVPSWLCSVCSPSHTMLNFLKTDAKWWSGHFGSSYQSTENHERNEQIKLKASGSVAKIKKVTCEMVYQCQAIRNFLDAQSYFQDRSQDYCSRVIECIRSRMAWFDLQLMRDVTSMLGPHGWEKAVEDDSTGAISI